MDDNSKSLRARVSGTGRLLRFYVRYQIHRYCFIVSFFCVVLNATFKCTKLFTHYRIAVIIEPNLTQREAAAYLA